MTDYKNLLIALGFSPKENVAGIFSKEYSQADNYRVEVNVEKQIIDYGELIVSDSRTTLNFMQDENWVVLECVNRLLEKGYRPQNIILEKTYPAGHGTSGRLDICVTRDDGSEYLLIECKTYGKEFDKAFARMKKDGGQLFTYFMFSRKAELIMLYASELRENKINYRNEIIKIEDNYRTGDVKDFYEKWDKLTKDNGAFEGWVRLYNFESKALTISDLREINPEDSSFIFNRFLEILRHNVVSDKPNAFNKIFTLFLCKIYDEKVNEDTENELGFQWIEGVDDDVSFQLRLTDLYKKGMYEFLEKKVTDFSEDEFDIKYQQLFLSNNDLSKELKQEINRIRLEKNNEFAIKEVYDRKSFDENAIVVKEVVELLQKYKVRYTQKQQYLSDFFELLLTTGLKQESGQFFTPVPVAQFIIKSLPIDRFVRAKLHEGKHNELLPYIIDYASGSGHFITESMHEIQSILNTIDTKTLKAESRSFVDVWRIRHFDWALQYIYGVEKDYRLVKVGKVGCYLHGDGLANVIHSDGLASFEHHEYKNKLLHKDKDFPTENKQFEIVVSNPPYSVSAFKNASREYYTEKDFDLYNYLTDNSSEIECLFVERTKQLLKDGGVAGVILPASILNSTGIYSKTRKLLLQFFEIVSIVELGVNTFMATKIKTVILFLRRKNNYESINLRKYIARFFDDVQDVTRNGIEKPVAKYVNHVWENISFDDYIDLLKEKPNKTVENHEIYREYRKKIKVKDEKSFWKMLIETEKEKLLYFILAYPQKIVMVKTGEKECEKQFLGYEFSERERQEGIHSFVEGKDIDECTKLFDAERFDNPEKASTYIYKAFGGEFDLDIHSDLKQNIEYVSLIDLIDFKSHIFDLKIEKTQKTNINYSEFWGTDSIRNLFQIAAIEKGKSITKSKTAEGNIPVVAGGQTPAYYHNESNRDGNIITISASGAYAGFVNYFDIPIFASDCNTVKSLNEDKYPTKLIYYCLKILQSTIYKLQRGQAQPHVYKEDIEKIKLPAFNEKQTEKIVSEIETLEEKAKTVVLADLDKQIEQILKKYLH
ncbi:MAG: N-6 DNA methylase [Prevotellaceae bacterium]|jgi:type I restriction enzyme M protein|nr:N-6 DNA methylase [Prevotellaceae bacterium]